MFHDRLRLIFSLQHRRLGVQRGYNKFLSFLSTYYVNRNSQSLHADKWKMEIELMGLRVAAARLSTWMCWWRTRWWSSSRGRWSSPSVASATQWYRFSSYTASATMRPTTCWMTPSSSKALKTTPTGPPSCKCTSTASLGVGGLSHSPADAPEWGPGGRTQKAGDPLSPLRWNQRLGLKVREGGPGEKLLMSESHRQRSLTHSGSCSTDDCTGSSSL